MLRRWIIRAVFLLPILLCLAGWVWSVTHSTDLTYATPGGRFIGCDTYSGEVWLEWGRFSYSGWRGSNESLPTSVLQVWHSEPEYVVLLGFGHGRFDYNEPGAVALTSAVRPSVLGYYTEEVAVPYWFLILLSSTVLFFVWRKTRPKINPKTAFPVELEKQHG